MVRPAGFEPATNGLKVHYATNCVTSEFMADPPGLEPGLRAPKTLVLPITPRIKLAPRVGVEPTTTRLTAADSAIELPRNIRCREQV